VNLLKATDSLESIDVNENEVRTIAASMQKAYNTTTNHIDAIESIRREFPSESYAVLYAMWAAIDAYVDNNIPSARV